MSAPRPSTLLLILALAVVVALFVVGVTFRHSDSGSADKRDLQERFLGKPRPVAAADLKGDLCRHPVAPGKACALEVAGSGSLVRSLSVSTTDAVTVTLAPKGQGRAVPVQLKRIGTSQRVDLQVGYRGAKVEITCLAPVNPMVGCQVHVG